MTQVEDCLLFQVTDCLFAVVVPDRNEIVWVERAKLFTPTATMNPHLGEKARRNHRLGGMTIFPRGRRVFRGSMELDDDWTQAMTLARSIQKARTVK